ncbi:hypothetical protein [Ekhidna sp.]|uniref:hypothetical protein n=1 Tax=Ekhidna sp. TaxID=2608089 RepID=UPI0032EE23DF
MRNQLSFASLLIIINRMKPHILLFTYLSLLFCFQIVSAQCSINGADLGDEMGFFAMQEELYKNPRLERGVQVVYGQFMLLANKEDPQLTKFVFGTKYIKSGMHDLIVPRVVIFQFTNGRSITVKAFNYDTESINNMVAHECLFSINHDQILEIGENNLKSMTIVDTRTKKRLSMTPYSKIFREQVSCIIGSYNEKYPVPSQNVDLNKVVEVFTCSAILASRDLGSNQIGRACSGKVRIKGPLVDGFYEVESVDEDDNFRGYLFKGSIK